MKDTPDYIYKKQFEIWHSKPLKERFLLNLELTEFVREMAYRRIKRLNPDFTEIDVKVKVFKETYSDVFTAEQMIEIEASMRLHHQKTTAI